MMVGASGKYAKAVVPELKKFGLIVDALVRDKDKGEIALRSGADRFSIGDLSDLQSLQNATRSVDGVFHIGPAFAADEAQLGMNIVKASIAANVKKFVFSGAIHPTISSMSNHANKQPVEQAVINPV